LVSFCVWLPVPVSLRARPTQPRRPSPPRTSLNDVAPRHGRSACTPARRCPQPSPPRTRTRTHAPYPPSLRPPSAHPPGSTLPPPRPPPRCRDTTPRGNTPPRCPPPPRVTPPCRSHLWVCSRLTARVATTATRHPRTSTPPLHHHATARNPRKAGVGQHDGRRDAAAPFASLQRPAVPLTTTLDPWATARAARRPPGRQSRDRLPARFHRSRFAPSPVELRTRAQAHPSPEPRFPDVHPRHPTTKCARCVRPPGPPPARRGGQRVVAARVRAATVPAGRARPPRTRGGPPTTAFGFGLPRHNGAPRRAAPSRTTPTMPSARGAAPRRGGSPREGVGRPFGTVTSPRARPRPAAGAPPRARGVACTRSGLPRRRGAPAGRVVADSRRRTAPRPPPPRAQIILVHL
jgi:hypothetical protein